MRWPPVLCSLFTRSVTYLSCSCPYYWQARGLLIRSSRWATLAILRASWTAVRGRKLELYCTTRRTGHGCADRRGHNQVAGRAAGRRCREHFVSASGPRQERLRSRKACCYCSRFRIIRTASRWATGWSRRSFCRTALWAAYCGPCGRLSGRTTTGKLFWPDCRRWEPALPPLKVSLSTPPSDEERERRHDGNLGAAFPGRSSSLSSSSCLAC